MHTPSGHRVLVVETYAIRAAAAAAAAAPAGSDEAPPPPPAPSLVLRATCHVAVPPTAFVFTGQGSAAKGMGMDLYASSPVAKRVWDEADAHLSKVGGHRYFDYGRGGSVDEADAHMSKVGGHRYFDCGRGGSGDHPSPRRRRTASPS